jgi:ubiquinone/menaquinone biosynthesis C-methylase UbiE
VESLPFADNAFDKALAINSMQVWPDAAAGLHEIWRVMRPGGQIALGFTRYSGQLNRGIGEALVATGFVDAHVKERHTDFCALAAKPNGNMTRSS